MSASSPHGSDPASKAKPGSGGLLDQRVTATRTPSFYEAGQDVTAVEDPVESYKQFIARVIREYESLALIFNFLTVDAEQSIGDQHLTIRRLFREGEQRTWSDRNLDAVADWLRERADAPLARD